MNVMTAKSILMAFISFYSSLFIINNELDKNNV